MNRDDEAEVLVVGAGPVGMLTALLLAEEGVQVRIIDKDWRTAARSYACVLHAGTLRLLDRLGLAQTVLAQGRRIDTVAFYEGETRRAELKLSQLPGAFPCVVALPQVAFENLLEQRLRQKQNIEILWNHRLADLEFEGERILAAIDKLKQSAKGYIVPEWDWEVQKRLQMRAGYVVGADGHDSMVRSRLNLECEQLAEPERFAIFEFETGSDPGSEVRVAVNETTTNVLWPLPGNRCRWTFQLVKTKDEGEFPDKDREAVRIAQAERDRTVLEYVQKLAGKRAPWFHNEIRDVYWWTRLRFERRLVTQFGRDRAWLAGDAAHQTGPVGVQSLNEGLNEAADLAGALKQALSGKSASSGLDHYNSVHRGQWQKLLGMNGGLKPKAEANTWFKGQGPRALSCIPATGAELAQLVGQLGFDF